MSYNILYEFLFMLVSTVYAYSSVGQPYAKIIVLDYSPLVFHTLCVVCFEHARRA